MTEVVNVLDMEKQEEISIEPPKNWKVIFHNDDKTPGGWVAFLLIDIFKYKQPDAINTMFKIDREGTGVVGVYPKSIAEQKKEDSVSRSRLMGYPLQVTIEREE